MPHICSANDFFLFSSFVFAHPRSITLNHLFAQPRFCHGPINPSSHLRWLSSGWSRSSDCTAGRERAVSWRAAATAGQTGEQRRCKTITGESVKWRDAKMYRKLGVYERANRFQWKVETINHWRRGIKNSHFVLQEVSAVYLKTPLKYT